MSAIIGYKKEMTQIFDKEGKVIPCTVIDVSDVRVVGRRTKEKDGYEAIILGIGKKRKPLKVEKDTFKNLKYVPKKVFEFRADKLEEIKNYETGSEVEASVFSEGDKVKITGITKGKGFQGVVRRWGFKGGPRTHGQSDRLRAGGSIGAGTDPGRVFKGKKMPGHMGVRKQTILNLEVVKIDKDKKLICVKGAVPGGRGSLLKIFK